MTLIASKHVRGCACPENNYLTSLGLPHQALPSSSKYAPFGGPQVTPIFKKISQKRAKPPP
jgi:hypothetical protein